MPSYDGDGFGRGQGENGSSREAARKHPAGMGRDGRHGGGRGRRGGRKGYSPRIDGLFDTCSIVRIPARRKGFATHEHDILPRLVGNFTILRKFANDLADLPI
jgi:hypothetical protein